MPFAPFPAFVLAPLVALVGRRSGGRLGARRSNALLATAGLGLLWRLAGRLGVALGRSTGPGCVVLFGFSTATWWVTMRGGVWHTGQLIASILTFAGLLEAFGRRRPVVMGLLAGAGFLTRATLVAALPYWVLAIAARRDPRAAAGRPARGDRRRRPPGRPGRRWGSPRRSLFGLWYNAVRFGNPLESGYGIAALPAFLEARRALGLFSPAHLAMNLDYFLLHLGQVSPFPWFEPDGLGLSVLVTSPGLLYAVRADWRNRETIALGVTALLVLVPSLLYYGGGWWQFGYRYALDAFPFVMALCAMAAARQGRHRLGLARPDHLRRRRQPVRGLLELQRLIPALKPVQLGARRDPRSAPVMARLRACPAELSGEPATHRCSLGACTAGRVGWPAPSTGRGGWREAQIGYRSSGDGPSARHHLVVAGHVPARPGRHSSLQPPA